MFRPAIAVLPSLAHGEPPTRKKARPSSEVRCGLARGGPGRGGAGLLPTFRAGAFMGCFASIAFRISSVWPAAVAVAMAEAKGHTNGTEGPAEDQPKSPRF